MSGGDGVRMQHALLGCEIVTEERFTEARLEQWHFLKMDDKLIPLGYDPHFASILQFALRRNAQAFEYSTTPPTPSTS